MEDTEVVRSRHAELVMLSRVVASDLRLGIDSGRITDKPEVMGMKGANGGVAKGVAT
jgi:hypothetical protein